METHRGVKIHWFHYDGARHFSFNSWSTDAEAEKLANDGFFYMGRGRDVICCGCGEVLTVTDADKTREDHAAQAVTCHLYRFKINTPSGPARVTVSVRDGTDSNLRRLIEADALQKSINRRYLTYTYRDDNPSFYRKLAINGFASSGCGVQSECTYCHFFVTHLVDPSESQQSHATHSPDCIFIKPLDEIDCVNINDSY